MSSAEENAARGAGARDDVPSADVWAEVVAEQEQSRPGPVEQVAEEREPVADTAAGTAEAGGAGTPGADESAESPFGGELPFGADLGPLVDEVRRFASAVGDKVTSLSSGSSDPMEVLQNLAAPLRSKSPAVYGHLLAAGGELIAAYRAAVSASERRWSAPKQDGTEHIDLD